MRKAFPVRQPHQDITELQSEHMSLPTTDCATLDQTSLRKYIRTDEDVQTFKTTTGYKYFTRFLQRLSESAKGQPLLQSHPPNGIDAIGRALDMIDTLDAWIDEIPPLSTPQRFGNLAFRDWGRRLEQVCTIAHCLIHAERYQVVCA